MKEITDDEARKAEIAAAAAVTEKPKKARKKQEAAAVAEVLAPPSPTEVVLNAGQVIDALGLVRKAVGKGPLAILSCVLIKIPEGGASMVLACTNCDMWAEVWVPIEKGADGRAADIAVSAAAMAKLLGEVEATEVSFDISDKLVIRAGGWRAELCGLLAQDFPPNPMDGGADRLHPLELGDGVLKKAMGAVACCVSTDSTRYVLNGVLLEFWGDELARVVATDGRRLAMVDTGRNKQETLRRIILPTAVVKLLLAALSDGRETAHVWVHQKDAPEGSDVPPPYAVSMVTGLGLRLWAKLIDGAYPEFTRVIPTEEEEPVLLDGKELVEMCGRASALEPEGVEIRAAGRAVTVLSMVANVGMWEESGEIISADDRMERPFRVRVNPDYAEVMAVGEQGRLDVGHARNAGPLVWRANLTAADIGMDYVAVLMPLRTEGGES